ncbi:MAG: alpha/beta hydrolase, partial [Gaiellales bacterium]
HEIDPFDLDKQYGAENAQKDAERVAKMMGIDPKKIPDGDDPKVNAAWWESVSEDERRIYLAAYPDQIGSLDGVPSDIRDRANRTVLEAKYNDLAMRAENGSLGIRDQATYNSLSKLKDRLDKGDTAPAEKRLYLLGLDPEARDGRAIIAMGNPDQAAHTAILVPGTGTDLSNMTGQIDRLDRTHDAASERARGEGVSVISWLGYDAPEVDGSVTTTGRAEDGASDLRHFTEGTRVAHGNGDSHLTVIGHSYGSTMVGTAAGEGKGLGADDIISLGSPGMNVGTAKDLQIDPQHFWAGASQQDPIVRHTSGLTLGPNPASEEFGGQPMAVNDGGHSSYWDPEQESLNNQARVIAGRPARLGRHYEAGPSDPPVNPVAPDGSNPLVIG